MNKMSVWETFPRHGGLRVATRTQIYKKYNIYI